ncbi:MAG: PD40 domain-containing protein [Chloroflexi bacterium]|nr:PD40 domain-containing protein [Chloroflexota bacterium]
MCENREAPRWVTHAKDPKDGVPDPSGRIVFGQITGSDDLGGQILAPLFAVDPDGSDLVQLLDCHVSRPRFSRDGSMLAFGIEMSDGSWQLATSAADGTNLRILTSYARSEETEKFGNPDWAPDGSWLAYGYNTDLWRIDVDGSHAQLFGAPDAFDAEPRFSPDGSQIVFLRGDFTKGVSEPWIRDLATGRERSLISANLQELEHPDWSKDGRSVIYNTLSDADGQHTEQIERMPVDDPASEPDVVAGTPGHVTFKPAYSPDGRRIVFGCDEQLCLMDADGSNKTVLVSVPDVHLNHFAWGVLSTPDN